MEKDKKTKDEIKKRSKLVLAIILLILMVTSIVSMMFVIHMKLGEKAKEELKEMGVDVE